MFRPEGRISLKEIWDAVGTEVYSRAKHEGWEDDYQSLSEATANICWEFFRKSATARVLMAGGNFQSFDPMILQTVDTDLTYNEHIDLQIGTIGSGKGGDQRELTLKKRYGPALFCPIVFTEAEFAKFTKAVEGAPLNQGNSDASIIKRIVAAYREDPTRNSRQIYEIAARNISWRHYTRLRARAAEVEPGIGKGGRKPAKKP